MHISHVADDSHDDRDRTAYRHGRELSAIDSGNLAAAGYDPDRSELTIRFRSQDATYLYIGVPAEVFEGLMSTSGSKNAYFVAYVKDRYACRQIG
jgi:hypothetical protein